MSTDFDEKLERIDISNAGEIRGEIVSARQSIFLDVPLFMHKDPRLFEVETNELIVRIAKCRDVFKVDRFPHVLL